MNDDRGPGLPLLMAACIALLIGGVFAVTWWRQPAPPTFEERFGPPPRPASMDPTAASPRALPLRPPLSGRALRDERFEELRRELATTRAQLEELRARYRERHPEEADLDWSDALAAVESETRSLLTGERINAGTGAAEPLPQDAVGAPPSDPALAEAPDENDVSVQLRDLRRRLEIAAFLDEQQRVEIEQLRADLSELSEALARQTQRERELTRWLDAERQLQSEASRTLIRLGPAAVGQLVDALQAEDAEIREWAADVLGAMGAAAETAVPDLLDARSDPDPDVRTAVRRALDAIERAER